MGNALLALMATGGIFIAANQFKLGTMVVIILIAAVWGVFLFISYTSSRKRVDAPAETPVDAKTRRARLKMFRLAVVGTVIVLIATTGMLFFSDKKFSDVSSLFKDISFGEADTNTAPDGTVTFKKSLEPLDPGQDYAVFQVLAGDTIKAAADTGSPTDYIRFRIGELALYTVLQAEQVAPENGMMHVKLSTEREDPVLATIVLKPKNPPTSGTAAPGKKTDKPSATAAKSGSGAAAASGKGGKQPSAAGKPAGGTVTKGHGKVRKGQRFQITNDKPINLILKEAGKTTSKSFSLKPGSRALTAPFNGEASIRQPADAKVSVKPL